MDCGNFVIVYGDGKVFLWWFLRWVVRVVYVIWYVIISGECGKSGCILVG